MRIGIIGAGNIGGNLVRRFAALGHDVAVANSRGPETLADLAAETGATAVPVARAADGADLVVVTIPMKHVPDLPAGVLDGAAPGAVIIDTNNYYPRERDGRIAAIEEGQTESGWVAEQLGRPVVKVFNGVYAARLLDGGFAIPVAGEDPGKATVMELVAAMGFTPVDAGTIDESWRMQPGTPVYGAELPDADAVRGALAQAPPERPPAFRA